MGVILSQGMIAAARSEFQNGTMERLCSASKFNGGHDVVQGLLWWMYDAKWIPVGLLSHDNEDFDVDRVPKVPQLFIAHKLKRARDYERFGAIRKTYFPVPETLRGNEYKDSRNARTGGNAWTLNAETCLPCTDTTCPPAMDEKHKRRVAGRREVVWLGLSFGLALVLALLLRRRAADQRKTQFIAQKVLAQKREKSLTSPH
jgi:hypothetical protein